MRKEERECRRICRESRSNFIYSFYLLPRKVRRAMMAFYAFCRLVDDVVDEPFDQAQGERLGFWREQVAKMYEGAPEHPVAKALARYVKEFNVPREYLEEIIAGCEMDLTKKEYATVLELDRYCYRVASCVGLVSLCFFGIPATLQNRETAVSLGKALQWTNILRDIVADLGKGRVYLPQEDLQKCGVKKSDLVGPTPANQIALLDILHLEIQRARVLFERAVLGFPQVKKELRLWLAPILIGRVYERLLDKISRQPLQIFAEKVTVSRGEKLKIVVRTLKELYF